MRKGISPNVFEIKQSRNHLCWKVMNARDMTIQTSATLMVFLTLDICCLQL